MNFIMEEKVLNRLYKHLMERERKNGARKNEGNDSEDNAEDGKMRENKLNQ